MYREVTSSTDPALSGPAQIGLGKCLMELGRYPELIEAMDQLLLSTSDASTASQAYLLKAWAYENLGDERSAADTYGLILEGDPISLSGYLHDWQGDAFWELGEYDAAGTSYRQALSVEPTSGFVQIEIKLAGTMEDRADFDGAIQIYQSIYDSTDEDYLKALMDRLLGQALIRLGQSEQAYAHYLDAVENYPQFSDSYLALVELVNAGVPVSEFDRGLVDYFAAQYSPALVAFNRFEALTPDEHDGRVHHYKALTLRALGEYELALQEWDRLIVQHPGDELIAAAWDEQVTTLWAYLDQYTQAIDLSEAYALAYPEDPRSAVFLFDAGRVAERDGKLERAAQLFRRAASDFPQAEIAPRAQFLAGVTLFRMGEMVNAHTAFLAAVEAGQGGEQRAAAQLWVGKTRQELGDHDGAIEAYRAATTEDPNGYYGLRAQERLAGGAPFASTGQPVFPNEQQLDGARQEAITHLHSRFPLAEGQTYGGIRSSILSEPGFQRGDLLWRLGRFSDAKTEFETLRKEYGDDVHRSFLLMEELLQRGFYQPAIYAAFDLIERSGYNSESAFDAPIYFNYVRFAPYFGELILGAARDKALDELFVLSLIRQESLFESFATSYAAAQGLMQIIPSTAAELVEKEGWPQDFTTADLHRPIVSVRLGVRYLADQRDLFGGDLYAALAAYNAGPGNALAWKSLSGEDQDLFLEVIRLEQPRDYIRVIFWAYAHYDRLYVQP